MPNCSVVFSPSSPELIWAKSEQNIWPPKEEAVFLSTFLIFEPLSEFFPENEISIVLIIFLVINSIEKLDQRQHQFFHSSILPTDVVFDPGQRRHRNWITSPHYLSNLTRKTWDEHEYSDSKP